ncbi:MAG: hypothetical protein OEW88_11280 [Gammaproteobacteria bacterium]|nr:hypothetical protein [Gammaproteobacteria bacterium]MDH5276995.1 hypothetical protein [Gammaproteobacteria bacterium]
MEIVYFSLVAILLYLGADWTLRRIESTAGRTLEHRSLVFFALLLGMALLVFALIRQVTS